MALQLSITVMNERLNAIVGAVGESPILKIFTGLPPVNCAAEDDGDVLATFILPATWMLVASGGTIVKTGTWEDSSADDSGIAGHFRLYDSGGTVCHIQGTVGENESGADIELSSVNITLGESISIASFTIEDGNA
jgi:hypothetical protein